MTALPDDETPPTLPGGDVPQHPRRGRGRPKGSKTKPRAVDSTAEREQSHTHIAEVVADAKAEKRGRERSFLRAPHGAAKERGLPGPRVELPPHDEMAQPVAKIADKAKLPKGPSGVFLPGETSAVLAGRNGGLAKKGKIAFGASLGLSRDILDRAPEEARKAVRKAASYRIARTSELAALAGGTCGVGVSAAVAASARAQGASVYLYQIALLEKNPQKAAKLFSASEKIAGGGRQHEAFAHELAVREAKARGVDRGHADPFAGLRAPLPAPLPAPESNRAVRGDMDNTTSAVRASGPALTAPMVTYEATRTGQLEPLTSPVVVDASARTDEIDSGVGR